MYDLDELQAQFEKVQHTANRLQAEKEDFHLDLERNREKCDKLQVSYLLIIIVKKNQGTISFLSIITSFLCHYLQKPNICQLEFY